MRILLLQTRQTNFLYTKLPEDSEAVLERTVQMQDTSSTGETVCRVKKTGEREKHEMRRDVRCKSLSWRVGRESEKTVDAREERAKWAGSGGLSKLKELLLKSVTFWCESPGVDCRLLSPQRTFLKAFEETVQTCGKHTTEGIMPLKCTRQRCKMETACDELPRETQTQEALNCLLFSSKICLRYAVNKEKGTAWDVLRTKRGEIGDRVVLSERARGVRAGN